MHLRMYVCIYEENNNNNKRNSNEYMNICIGSYFPPVCHTNVNTVSTGAQVGSPQTTSFISIMRPMHTDVIKPTIQPHKD